MASNHQLEVIVKYENCSTHLLGGAVIEMLNRGLFDRIIGGCIRKIVRGLDKLDQTYGLAYEDLMQIGRIEVIKAIEEYNPRKGKNFVSFAWLKVKSQIIKELTYLEAEKRDTKNTISYNAKTDEGTEILSLFEDKKNNVEKYVVNKVTIEQLLERVNEYQKTVILYRLKGYTFPEIADLLGKKSYKQTHQAYTLGIKKMIKGA